MAARTGSSVVSSAFRLCSTQHSTRTGNQLHSYGHPTIADGSCKRVQTVKNAHAGEKINCAAVTCEAVECPGYLYSGGSDKSVRVWTLPDLLPACAPLVHHNAPVRAISTSLHHVLSADADGVLAIWDVSTVLDSYQVEDDYLSPAAPGDGSAV